MVKIYQLNIIIKNYKISSKKIYEFNSINLINFIYYFGFLKFLKRWYNNINMYHKFKRNK